MDLEISRCVHKLSRIPQLKKQIKSLVKRRKHKTPLQTMKITIKKQKKKPGYKKNVRRKYLFKISITYSPFTSNLVLFIKGFLHSHILITKTKLDLFFSRSCCIFYVSKFKTWYWISGNMPEHTVQACLNSAISEIFRKVKVWFGLSIYNWSNCTLNWI